MKNNKTNFLAGFLAGCVVMILVTFVGFQAYYTGNFNGNYTGNTGGETQEIDQKINLLEQYIEKYYLFEDANPEAMKEGIYRGLVGSLEDKYSGYYTAEEYQALEEETSGSYAGIGAYISQDMNTGIMSIVKCFPDSPAEKAGLLPGDMIYKVNGKEVTGADMTTLIQTEVKGEPGTQVELTIYRETKGDYLDITVTREIVTVTTVEYEMLPENIGYILVSQFEDATEEQFMEAIDALEDQGMKSLIIDLRDNPGGLVSTVVHMADRILEQGTIVSMKDKEGNETEYHCEDKKSFDLPLVVLVNGNSASASEIFAGAIQDSKAGTILGTQTYGKGIVQSYFTLTDGSCIKLTTDKYYTPSGRSIHGTGITPDVEVELKEELKTKVTIEKDEDNQLQEAISYLKER